MSNRLQAEVPASPPPQPMSLETASEYYHLAASFRNQRYYDLALRDFNKAIAGLPGYSLAYNGRGILYGMTDRFEEAVADFDQAIALNPEDQVGCPFNNRGLVRYRQQRYREALADLDEALKHDLCSPAAHYNRALVLRATHKNQEALEEFSIAAKSEPDFEKNAEARYYRAMAYEGLGDHTAALADFDQAIALRYRRLEWAYYSRSFVWSDKGQPEKAVADLSKAVQFNPGFSWGFHQRGVSYFALGLYAEAETDFRLAILLDPKDPKPRIVLGFLSLAEGKRDAAKAIVSAFVDFSATMPDTAYAALQCQVLSGDQLTSCSEVIHQTEAFDQKEWPLPLLAHLRGKLDLEALRQAAEQGSPEEVLSQRAEMAFYLAETALTNGDKAEAKRLFTLAAKPLPHSSEPWTAQGELRRLSP